jgi:hypothetical protein
MIQAINPAGQGSNIEGTAALFSVTQLVIRFLQDAQEVENVLYVLTPQPLVVGDADAVFAVVNPWITTTLRPRQAANVVYKEVVIQDEPSMAGPRFVYPGDLLSGTHSGDPSNNATTIAIRKNTSGRGAHFRGRIYHIGLADNVVTNNNVEVVEITAILSTYEALLTALETAGYPLLHAYRASGPPPQPLVGATPVTSFTVSDTIVDTQRRRLPGRGR